MPFAEATKSVVPVASDPKGIEIVKTSMVRLSSGKQDERLFSSVVQKDQSTGRSKCAVH